MPLSNTCRREFGMICGRYLLKQSTEDLKMISSPYCAVSAPQSLRVSFDGMRIDVIRYELLTFSLRHFKFFFQQFL